MSGLGGSITVCSKTFNDLNSSTIEGMKAASFLDTQIKQAERTKLEGKKDKEVDKIGNDDLAGIVGKIEEEMNR